MTKFTKGKLYCATTPGLFPSWGTYIGRAPDGRPLFCPSEFASDRCGINSANPCDIVEVPVNPDNYTEMQAWDALESVLPE